MKESDHWQIWVDTGGTFTDCIATSPEGDVRRLKVLSSGSLRGTITAEGRQCRYRIHHSWVVSEDIFQGYNFFFLNKESEIRKVVSFDPFNRIIELDYELKARPGDSFEIHANEEAPVLCARLVTHTSLDQPLPPINMRLGSTRGTNALLERKGAKVAFLVTKGFKDLITIGNQQRPHLFSLDVHKEPPVYKEVFEVDERTGADGEVIRSLDQTEIQKLIDQIKSSGVDAFAIAFINSYINPTNEQMLTQALTDAGFEYISASSDLSRSIKILPRAETAVVNAYLSQVIEEYLSRVKSNISEGRLRVMSSSGGLADARFFTPKDSLLSGPAGGVVGAAAIARRFGENKALTFDMGGTSTDVARYDEGFEYRHELKVGHATLQSPSVHIETVAAGGGSICDFDGFRLTVGPESAGAKPGPACYGMGGPMAITDVNLLLGRIDTDQFGVPVSCEAAKNRLNQIREKIEKHSGKLYSDEELLEGFLSIANEKMAEAISNISVRRGYDPTSYALLGFGGAGGQHTCKVAEKLGVKKAIIPYDAGLLSAYGMGQARIERFNSKQVLQPFDEFFGSLKLELEKIESAASEVLQKEGFTTDQIEIQKRSLYLRFFGQDTTLEIEFDSEEKVLLHFKEEYQRLYGHWVDRPIEIESIKVMAASKSEQPKTPVKELEKHKAQSVRSISSYFQNEWKQIPVFDWEVLNPGAEIAGPALLVSNNSTVIVEQGWTLVINQYRDAILGYSSEIVATAEETSELEEIQLELFTNRFKGIAEEMGALLIRTAFSVNVKERLDFSCGLLDANGELVVNAPHIPVHLGGLGICVRTLMNHLPMEEGDIVITNHPGYGGSHLPDITLVSPVFYKGRLIAFLANRAHHAELGGKRPGSMPPDAKNLNEEGVVIKPTYLVKNGEPKWKEIRKLLTGADYPSRAVEENLADLNAGVASLKAGENALIKLCDQFGTDTVVKFMNKLQNHAFNYLSRKLATLETKVLTAEELLDDGHCIKVKITIDQDKMIFDFAGSSPVHPGNLNANRAIVGSAVIYVLRLLVDEDIPLNEGLMKKVKIRLPKNSFLNPDFPDDANQCPAVVGGNVETSQRIVDTLIKAFGLAACSQGTMNNLLFGNDDFGYYETICGGTGAGEGFNGTDAVHQHMTNTRITDPEIMEHRYPVWLNEFSIREGSCGSGKWKGGNGITRELEFLEEVELTILSQHRKEAPYGLKDGNPGQVGSQKVVRNNGKTDDLSGIDGTKMNKGDKVIINTPGGGGFGKA